VRALASPTAPIRSSACLTTKSNDNTNTSKRAADAYPARHR
jgi:hypothetical protein